MQKNVAVYAIVNRLEKDVVKYADEMENIEKPFLASVGCLKLAMGTGNSLSGIMAAGPGAGDHSGDTYSQAMYNGGLGQFAASGGMRDQNGLTYMYLTTDARFSVNKDDDDIMEDTLSALLAKLQEAFGDDSLQIYSVYNRPATNPSFRGRSINVSMQEELKAVFVPAVEQKVKFEYMGGTWIAYNKSKGLWCHIGLNFASMGFAVNLSAGIDLIVKVGDDFLNFGFNREGILVSIEDTEGEPFYENFELDNTNPFFNIIESIYTAVV